MSPVTSPRVLIASDQVRLSEEYAKLLQPEFQVVSIVADEPALMAAVRELKPDVILLDLGESWASHLETRAHLKKVTRMVRIVFITTAIDADIAADAARGGVSGYLLRTSDEANLVSAVREVLKGKRYISASILHAIEDLGPELTESHLSRKTLTDRELEVLRFLAEGRTMKEIAYILMLTPRTVAFHKYKLMERLGLQTNADLVQYAIQEHILTPRS
ncbi:MAG TPA: response regulator transcription factor [Acidobacteriaceae bacterium]|jgi:two-component system response regulator NreC|nr:response regulator transcription factor [Acidobacteriaceae bacterium]